MSSVLFESPAGRVPRWEITRYSPTDPTLIRFVKCGRTSKLLDQVARWAGRQVGSEPLGAGRQGAAGHHAPSRRRAGAAGGGGVSYPMTTTLNRIWACNPCDEGKKRALRAAGKDAPDDEPITYQQIVESAGLDDALWCCRAEPQYDRKWRLFAVWCARQVQHLISDQRSLDALDVAERYAHGEATDTELAAARAAAWDAALDESWYASAATASARVARAADLDASAAARAAARASSAAQRDAFIQLVTTGELPPIARQEVAS